VKTLAKYFGLAVGL